MTPWRSILLAALFQGAELPVAQRQILDHDDGLASAASAFRGDLAPLASGLSHRANHLALQPVPALADEALRVWAPMADHMGLRAEQVALEDASFRALHPVAHQLLDQSSEASTRSLSAALRRTTAMAADLGIVGRHEGRIKTPYSTWTKMERKGLALDEVLDRVAVRWITRTEGDARRLLAQIHTVYMPIDGAFDDYIANPKPNGYRSLHTAVNTPDGVVEFQIRTEAMHQEASSGAQSHWRYKRTA